MLRRNKSLAGPAETIQCLQHCDDSAPTIFVNAGFGSADCLDQLPTADATTTVVTTLHYATDPERDRTRELQHRAEGYDSPTPDRDQVIE
jgi:hypothetical protein